MSATDSFMGMAQNFISPEMVQKFSGALEEPGDKMKTGLKSGIPILLMGIINKGKTSEGAASLINMATQQSTPSKDMAADNQVVNGIFGGNLNSVVTKLGALTGMDSSKVTKMLGMAAPVVMGFLGSKIRKDNLNATGLMSFLSQQKPLISGLAPEGLMGAVGSLSSPSLARKTPWLGWVIAALAIVAGVWWLINRSANQAVVPSATSTKQAQVIIPAQLSTLSEFLRTGSTSELPKRFRFESLRFQSGTAVLESGADSEMNQIATAMKDNPAALARLEGFTDNTGQVATNAELSKLRSDTVKQQLVARGVAADRITTAGLGSETPLAPNDTEEGRSMNRRIEFVITQIR